MPNPHTPPATSPHANLWIDLLLNSVDPTSGAPTGADVVQALTRLARAVEQNTVLLETLMTTGADVLTKVTNLEASLASAVARIQAHEDAEATADAALQAQVQTLTDANTALQTEIDALKAAGTDTTTLDAIMAKLNGVQTEIESIDPAPAPAPAPAQSGGETPVP
jgi:hypothetical protein